MRDHGRVGSRTPVAKFPKLLQGTDAALSESQFFSEIIIFHRQANSRPILSITSAPCVFRAFQTAEKWWMMCVLLGVAMS